MKNAVAGMQLACLVVLTAAAVPVALEHLDARAQRQARAARMRQLVGVGDAALARGDAALAAKAYADAVAVAPDDGTARAKLLDAQVDRMLDTGGVINAGNALALQVALTQRQDAGDPRHHLALGRVLQFRGQIDAARAAYAGGVARDPEDARGHLFLGDLHLKLGEHEAAVRHLRRALALDETRPGVRLALGQAYLAQKDHDEARGLLDAAVKARPDDARARAALGQVALAQGDFAAARVHLERAVLAAPESAGTYARLGDAWAGLEKPERAIQAWRRAWRLGNDLDALRKTARAQAKARQFEAAYESFQALASVVPDDVEAHLMSGQMAHAAGQARAAVAAYERAIQYAGQAEVHTEARTQAMAGIETIRRALAAAKAGRAQGK